MRFYTCTELAHIADMQAALRAADDPSDSHECEALLALAGFPASLNYLIPHAAWSEQIRRALFRTGEEYETLDGRRDMAVETMADTPPDAAGIARVARPA